MTTHYHLSWTQEGLFSETKQGSQIAGIPKAPD